MSVRGHLDPSQAVGSPAGPWVSWSLTSPKPLRASPSLASMMVPAPSLLGTMGTLLGGCSPGKAPGMRGGGLHPQERKMRLAGTNPALPSPPCLRQGPQARGTHRDPALVWHPQDLLAAPGWLPRLGTAVTHCSSSSPQGALAGHTLRMDGSREELALHSRGGFSMQASGSTHMAQAPCPGCHTSQPHRAPLASSAPPWSQGRCSGHTARAAKQPNTLSTPSPAQLGLSTRLGWGQPSSCKCGFDSCRQTWYRASP